MDILEMNFVDGFIRMCNDGFLQGWHERNGGNLSYRLKSDEVELIKDSLNFTNEFEKIGDKVPNLANEFFLVTGSGKYFRNVIINPEENITIIQIDGTGEEYRVVWGLTDGGRPTSELPSHLLNHSVKKRVTNDKHRVIYHCHTTNIIALTFVLPLEGKVFTRELWEMATECPVVFPDGIGIVDWMVPGGEKIAIATSELMEKYDVVIWSHHGIFLFWRELRFNFWAGSYCGKISRNLS